MASFSVHFDGSITVNHRVPVRVLAKTYEHMQRAIDRAHLVNKYGAVYKNAHLKDEDYAITQFMAEYPREGGIFLDAIKDGAETIIDHIQEAVRRVYEPALDAGLDQQATFAQELHDRKNYVAGMGANTQTFQALRDRPVQGWEGAYSDRSIVKEIDQLVGQIRGDHVEGSIVELQLHGNNAYLPFSFDSQIAGRFHHIVSRRELAAAVIVRAKIRHLDTGNKYAKPKAKILNLDTGREVTLHLNSLPDFYALHPYHTAEEVAIYAAPVVEAGGFDLMGGDLQFLAVQQ